MYHNPVSGRRVPLSIHVVVLFGGFINQFGWIFFGFGMIFVWVFMGNADYSSLLPEGRTEKTIGTVVRVEKTGASENNASIYRHEYEFRAMDSRDYSGTAYMLGDALHEGDQIEIEYPSGKPQRSRAVGMRGAMFSPVVSFVLLFPLVGLGFMIAGIRRGVMALGLLSNGIITTGKLVSKEMTNTRVNNSPVYRLTFAFTTENGSTHGFSEKTHQTWKLEDEAEERLVYDPQNPERAMAIDNMPGLVSIGDDGVIKPAGVMTLVMSSFIPLISIAGHGMYILSLF